MRKSLEAIDRAPFSEVKREVDERVDTSATDLRGCEGGERVFVDLGEERGLVAFLDGYRLLFLFLLLL
jgi:hypothetical protein